MLYITIDKSPGWCRILLACPSTAQYSKVMAHFVKHFHRVSLCFEAYLLLSGGEFRGFHMGGLPISLGTLWLILAEDSMGFLNGSVGVVQMTWGFNGLGTGGCVDFMKKIRCVHQFEPDLAMEILCHATRFTRDSMDWTEISMGYWQRIMMGLSPFLRKQSQMLHGAGIFTYIETPKMAQWCR